jgi:glutamine amidotransferase
MTTVVIDHGRANLFSLCHALAHLGIPHTVGARPSDVASATRLFLPGVGAFGDVMKGLAERGLMAPLKDAIARRVPLLGICVGMQILAEQSEEFGCHAGLGAIEGTVRRLPDLPSGVRGIRVPNIGWRALRPMPADPLLSDLAPETMTYFVHSYSFEPRHGDDVAATIDFNGRAIAAVVRRGSILGYQFHPEKSGPAGLALLRRFMDVKAGAN